jgi:antitoxin (DNA-binding transcriptional repressor) of toxin-antitoxin stability system
MKQMDARDFLASFDELLDEIEATGLGIEIMMDGRACARMLPITEAEYARHVAMERAGE